MRNSAKLFTLIILVLLLCSFAVPALATDSTLETSLPEIVSYYTDNKTDLDSWEEVIGLKNAGVDLSDRTWQLPEWDQLNESSLACDYAKNILGMLAAGQNPNNVDGRDTVTELVYKQTDAGDFGGGINNTIWSVIALDTAEAEYDVTGAVYYLRDQQKADGGFAFSGDISEPDITGLALMALAAHTDVAGEEVIADAKDCLKNLQLESGGFSYGGNENTESIACVIRGLVACGEDITSANWTKNGNTMIDALFRFQLENNSFSHLLSGGSDSMATRQALIAVADLVNGNVFYNIEEGVVPATPSEPTEKHVRVQVEGATENLADQEVTVAGTALKALEAAVGSENVTAPGGFITTILDESGQNGAAEGINTGWCYYVIRDGAIEQGAFAVGAGSYNVEDGDEVIFYIGAYDAATYASKTYLPIVTVNPEEPAAGQTVTLTISEKKYDWSQGLVDLTSDEKASIGDYTVKVGETEYTSQYGQVVIPGVAEGVLAYRITNANTANYPDVVSYEGSLTVAHDNGGGSSSDTCSVGVAVVGPDGEVLYGPRYVDVSENNEWGLTALGALDATRVDYEMSEDWEGFIGSICGVENEGMSGWMYTVNGRSPTASASEYDIDSGDKVIWYYSESMEQAAPEWDDLEEGSGTGSSTAKDIDTVLEEIADGDYEASEAVEVIFNSVNQLKESDLTDEVKKQLEEAAQKTAQLIEKLPADALEIKTEGSKATVNVDEELLDSQITAVKKAAELAEKLKELGITGHESLVQDNVVIELPLADGANDQIIELEADTARRIADSSLGLSLKNSLTGISLPCETLNMLLDAAKEVSKLEVATQKIAGAQLNAFDGAEPIGDKSFDIKISAIAVDGSKLQPNTNFTKKVTISISLDGLDLTAVNKDRLAIYRQNEDGSWEYVGGRLSADGKSFIFETEHLSIYSLLEFKGTFSDISGHWARDVIEEMAMKMITTGMGDGSFAPDKQLTKAEFAAFLVRALGLEKTVSSSVVFSDVAPQYWGRQAIAAAYQAGLVLGTGQGKFQPECTITREEMAVMIVRALQKSGVEATVAEEKQEETFAPYADAKEVSAWAQEALAAAINSGIVKGRTEATLEPSGKATRAEALVVIQRMLSCLAKA